MAVSAGPGLLPAAGFFVSASSVERYGIARLQACKLCFQPWLIRRDAIATSLSASFEIGRLS
ncbi:hypothetical protein [Salinisphaera sp. Q1T1-3]|uniref:hypothetical protein n=1 Tax=Salinisphaera sp. Q1T1-3 TaxID=2321229 RepID=UPI0011C46886|nr:hypothetical protein [Salinisphaera sp. Q1T1-3]